MNAIRKEIRILGIGHQQGAALVIAVIILLILTVVGIYAVTTSTIETKITGFEKTYKEAFFTADSGEPMGVELTKIIIHEVPSSISDLPAPWKYVVPNDSNLLTEIFTDPTAPRTWDPGIDSKQDGATPNLGFSGTVRLRVDIDRLESYQISGGAMEFGSGYEGIGQGGGGEVGIIYAIDSLGNTTTFTNAESMIEAGYLHVVGMPGG